jgi:hypothetical protein
MNRFQNNQFKQLRLQPTQTYSKVINQTIIDKKNNEKIKAVLNANDKPK